MDTMWLLGTLSTSILYSVYNTQLKGLAGHIHRAVYCKCIVSMLNVSVSHIDYKREWPVMHCHHYTTNGGTCHWKWCGAPDSVKGHIYMCWSALVHGTHLPHGLKSTGEYLADRYSVCITFINNSILVNCCLCSYLKLYIKHLKSRVIEYLSYMLSYTITLLSMLKYI